jgi:hypothetical protein
MNARALTLATVGTVGLLAGTAMAGQSTGAPNGTRASALVVVDRKGAVVGNFSAGNVIREIEKGVWVSFAVARAGIGVVPLNSVRFLYTSSNCTGTAYLDVSEIPIQGYAVGTTPPPFSNTATIYYPSLPYQSLPISSRIIDSGQPPPSNCQTITPEMVDVGVAKSVPLTVVAPLSVQ